jgi:hypothetical protein
MIRCHVHMTASFRRPQSADSGGRSIKGKLIGMPAMKTTFAPLALTNFLDTCGSTTLAPPGAFLGRKQTRPSLTTYAVLNSGGPERESS